MSAGYKAVSWTRDKKRYDAVVLGGLVVYLATFMGLSIALWPDATAEILLMRALGTAALILLHVVLAIGPLARLDHRFLPLLYNRRHLGVTMFLVALAHGLVALVTYHAMGDLNPLVSVLVSDGRLDSLAWFPFQPLGLAALAILFAMAATSHDFWLANLTAPVWKALHMGVYLAWLLVLAHVALGILQAETSPLFSGLLLLGALGIGGLHLLVGLRATEPAAPGEQTAPPELEGYVDCGAVDTIPEGRARIVCLSGERVAIFRYEGVVSAVSNVCKHQNGPLGEGRVIDGCITCPWHGYQYRPEDGASPPPFTESVPTFAVAVRDGHVWVHPVPHPAGTRVEPARVDGGLT